jgi:hypothetical protein
MVNVLLIKWGYAAAATYPPDVRYQETFLELAETAREEEKGLWARPTAVPTVPPSPTSPPPAPVCDCSANIYDCGDFGTHAAAQACYEYCLSLGVGDTHQLDGDNDGVACEAPPPTAVPTTAPPPPTSPPPAPVCDCSGNIYNCGDFGTHAAAQACYEYCLSLGVGDIHRLDGDNDGVACESLP